VPSLDEIVAYFETVSPESVARIDRVYAPDAYFKDPFNEVRGVDAVRRVFAHMFEQVDDPRFAVTAHWQGADGVIVAWDFTFGVRGTSARRLVRGVSHLRLAADGRIDYHRDYWDPAEGVYETIPVLGALMRLLKRKLAA
jgi:steroid Delta-isomerase